MVLPVTQVLAFGAWLVAQSKATSRSPTISVFLKPPGVIPPGGSATICCSCQQDSGNFVLYKNGRELRTLQLHGTRAEFPIFNASHQDAGAYTCHCLGGGTVLARSETLDIMVQEFHLPKPILSVLPGQEVATGTYVIFRCTIVHPSAGCFLYLEGQIEALSLLSKERDHFNLSSVHKGNGGRYSCQCFTRDASFQWSAASKPLDLVVRADYTRSNVARLALGAAVLLLLGLLVAAAPPALGAAPPAAGGGRAGGPGTGTSKAALGSHAAAAQTGHKAPE
ncbi:immunoglobulin superfamily member 1-like isoform X2 [Falco biarmicus]|uniref:immunoglobulin superfamily member 1-like n=1 Tax=Falco rusticolus TaxID=120794 RepID=UPI0018866312|nr:immunoglobulin superfamily member 1-like [Falco rusticolus]XP_055578997.1 immunoglobulin superfamily member 1-like isoform X2 [Falco cherrug]XP_056211052.1 immunoglobulin superfamily member 1-like isoform X2 [Falco biarmicus]